MASRFDPSAPKAKALTAGVEAQPPHLRPVAPKVLTVPPPHLQLFTLVRSVPRGAERLTDLRKLFPNLEQQVEILLTRYGQKSSLFGMSGPGVLADRMLQYVGNFGFRATTFAEFIRALRGYRSNMNGEWFHWRVEADPNLRADVLAWSRAERDTLQNLAKNTWGLSAQRLATRTETLVDTTGSALVLPSGGRFQDPLFATDIKVRVPGGSPRPFVDSMTVSFYLPRQSRRASHLSLTALGQYKFRWAINKLAKQMSEDPGRLTQGDAKLLFKVGGVDHSFFANQVVFSAQQGVPNLNRYAVTHFNDLPVDVPKPAPVYAADLETLLGGERPQVTPFVARGGTVRGILIEMNIRSGLFTDLTALLLGH
ncbi:hypothetical protein ABZ208_37595 [Streptomyces sp. NPDC006208]|uniref:hypothetical protein n=1 Tax=Streptomyces sp. NPDC006208 TaxID=3156734 RepID=UPI0033AE6670